MKLFKKLDTGVWTHTDKNGHVHVFTNDEFIKINQMRTWWSNVKKRYFKL
tara:strand:- start:383 stop:532 length:150 start_codon:yes stop_codon:yes gene_type:complete